MLRFTGPFGSDLQGNNVENLIWTKPELSGNIVLIPNYQPPSPSHIITVAKATLMLNVISVNALSSTPIVDLILLSGNLLTYCTKVKKQKIPTGRGNNH